MSTTDHSQKLKSVNENETLNKTAAEGLVLDNDTDSDGDSLVISDFHAGALNEASQGLASLIPLDGDYGQLILQTDGSYSYSANKSAADELGPERLG